MELGVGESRAGTNVLGGVPFPGNGVPFLGGGVPFTEAPLMIPLGLEYPLSVRWGFILNRSGAFYTFSAFK